MQRNEDGIWIEPFNLNSERETGYYDASGNYVWTDNPREDAADPWLAEMDEAERVGGIKLPPAVAQSKAVGSEEDREREEDKPDLVRSLHRLVTLLQPGETVGAALRRLSSAARRSTTARRPATGRRGRHRATAEATATEATSVASDSSNESASAASSDLDALTEAADELVGTGQTDVYSMRYQDFLKQLNAFRVAQEMATHPQTVAATSSSSPTAVAGRSGVGDATAAAAGEASAAQTGATSAAENFDEDAVLWEYKWSKDAAETYGPYTSTQMHQWTTSGMFTPPPHLAGAFTVHARRVRNPKRETVSLEPGGAPPANRSTSAADATVGHGDEAKQQELLQDLDEEDETKDKEEEAATAAGAGQDGVRQTTKEETQGVRKEHWDWTPVARIDLRRYAALE